jgi:rhamnosyltransferase
MKILILLSTFNGNLFLPELLNSLYCQEEIVFEILVRDDGSTDDTKNILRQYNNRYGNITVVEGKNIGARKSFLELIQMASKRNDFDYAAFCDQDDVWLPQKLSAAVTLMQQENTEFYYSPYQLVNQNLKKISSYNQFIPIKNLATSLVYNSVTGCTIVCTKKIIEWASEAHPEHIMMHDSWIFKVALAHQCGISIDSRGYILYRQHGDNVIGGTETLAERFKRRWHNFIHPKCLRSMEAEELYRYYYESMNPENQSIIKQIHNYRQKSFISRLSIAFNPVFRTGSITNDLIFKLAIITKRY